MPRRLRNNRQRLDEHGITGRFFDAVLKQAVDAGLWKCAREWGSSADLVKVLIDTWFDNCVHVTTGLSSNWFWNLLSNHVTHSLLACYAQKIITLCKTTNRTLVFNRHTGIEL